MTTLQKVEFVLMAVIAAVSVFLAIYQFFKYGKEKRRLIKKIKYLEKEVTFDYLTGAYSRSAFIKLVNEALAENPNAFLLIFDIDGFKSVNDTLGHIEGDKLLKRFADRLKKVFEGAPVGRLGGDEFMVFLNDGIDEKGIAERFKKADVAKLSDKSLKLKLFACCGVARSPKHGENFDQLYRMADEALYKSKSNSSKLTFCE